MKALQQDSKVLSTFVLLWTFVQALVGLHLFTTGFFLTRYQVTTHHTCEKLPDNSTSTHHNLRRQQSPSQHDSHPGCWFPASYDKAIILLIDALRFDFVDKIEEEESDTSSHHSYFHNHFTALQDPSGLLYKFEADAPTMTMQRLKGLTTGTLPTFLDIKDNMQSSSSSSHSALILEDNWLSQLKLVNKSLVFMGDDTWETLYSHVFDKMYSYESFNVKDLNSVDNGVKSHLFPLLAQNNNEEDVSSDFDVLIAHCLGVDHVGHTFGPSDGHMEVKLEEMDRLVSRVKKEMGSNTLLVVMGDHGMSADGNHGGATDDETGSALFFYTKDRNLSASTSSSLYSSHRNSDDRMVIPQVDLVPTLSLLLGVPIPFGSLGSVIPELFPNESHLRQALELNVLQVRQYLLTYTNIFASASKNSELFQNLEKLHDDIQKSKSSSNSMSYIKAMQRYLRSALETGRQLWTQFDLVLMTYGVVILVFLCINLLVLLMMVNKFDIVKVVNVILFSGISGALLSTTLSSAAVIVIIPSSIALRAMAFGIIATQVSVVVMLLASHCSKNATSSSSITATKISLTVVTVLHILSLLSNSYIVAEKHVFTFLSASVGVIALCHSLVSHKHYYKSSISSLLLLFLVAGRASNLLVTTAPNIIITTVSFSQTLLPMTLLAIVFYKRGRGAPGGILMLILVLAYWTMMIIVASPARQWIPRGIYAVTVLSAFTKNSKMLEVCLISCLLLVTGPSSSWPILCFYLQLVATTTTTVSSNERANVFLKMTMIYVSTCHGFFSTGHDNTFTSLQNSAGFVGFDTFNYYAAGALLGYNTFGVYVIGVLLLVRNHHQHSTFGVILLFGMNTAVTTIFVAFQRRHLMVWAIFAPKFIFDGIVLLIVNASAIVGQLLL